MTVPQQVEIHAFKEADKWLVLDVARNAVHALQELDWQLLSRCDGQHTLEQVAAGLCTLAEARQVLACLEKLHLLDNNAPCVSADWQSAPRSFDLMLNVSQGCNLACRYCFVERGTYGLPRQGVRTMTERTARQAVDLLSQVGAAYPRHAIHFYGGEPLLNLSVIRATVAYAKQQARRQGKEIVFEITTNGTLLNEAVIAFLRDEAFHVLVSLDGPSAVHDEVRVFPDGRSSHDQVLHGAIRLLAQHSHVGASAVIRRGSRLAPIVDYLMTLGFPVIKAEWIRCDRTSPYALTDDDIAQYKDDLRRVCQQYVAAVFADRKFPVKDFQTRVMQLWKRTRRRYYCGAARTLLGVSAEGDLYPCALFVGNDDYRLGTLTSGPRPEALRQFAEAFNVETFTPCRNCWARYLCGGGCPATRAKLGSETCGLLRHQIQLAIAAFVQIRETKPEALFAQVDPTFLEFDLKDVADRQ